MGAWLLKALGKAPQPAFPAAPRELRARLGRVVEVTKAKWPPGALARGTATRWRRLARSPRARARARHPQPLTLSHTLRSASPGAA